MDNVKCIEKAVQALAPDELAEFRRWFAEFDADACAARRHSGARSPALCTTESRPLAPFSSLQDREQRSLYSVRVGLYYRALGLPVSGGVHWFWIGAHAEYEKLVG